MVRVERWEEGDRVGAWWKGQRADLLDLVDAVLERGLVVFWDGRVYLLDLEAF